MLREFYLAHECISDHVPRRCVLVRYVNRHDEQHHLGNRYQVAAKDGFTYTYTHDLDNQYTHIHGEYVWGLTEDAYPEYDDNGNLQTDNWGRQYYYDYRNRLTEIGGAVQYGYDALGRRVSKYDEDNNLTTYFYYDTFGRVIAEYEKPDGEDEAFARSFVYGNGIDEVLAMFLPEKSFDPNDVIELAAFCEDWLTSNATYDYDSSGVVDFNDFAVLAADGASLPATKETRFYYFKDALGSVVGIVGGKFQREADREFYLYDAYGTPSDASVPSAAGNPYFFTGRRLDPESGLYYYRARTYDPETGRFLQTDPIGYADSMNLYEYVMSNPTNWVDPWGLLKHGFLQNPEDFWKDADKPKKATKIVNWFKDFKQELGPVIEEKARKYCIPKELLAGVIAVEQIDYSGLEKAYEYLMANDKSSYGPAQITPETAQRYKLLGESFRYLEVREYTSNSSPYWYAPVQESTRRFETYKPTIEQLRDVETNIDAAAKLMKTYLDALCKRGQTNAFSRSFLEDIASDCKIADYCCMNKKECDVIVDSKVPSCLLRAMVFVWNNGIEDTATDDIPSKRPRGYRHSQNANPVHMVMRKYVELP